VSVVYLSAGTLATEMAPGKIRFERIMVIAIVSPFRTNCIA